MVPTGGGAPGQDVGRLGVEVAHGHAVTAHELEHGLGAVAPGPPEQAGAPAGAADLDVAGIGDEQGRGRREGADREADLGVEAGSPGGALEVVEDWLLPSRTRLHDD